MAYFFFLRQPRSAENVGRLGSGRGSCTRCGSRVGASTACITCCSSRRCCGFPRSTRSDIVDQIYHFIAWLQSLRASALADDPIRPGALVCGRHRPGNRRRRRCGDIRMILLWLILILIAGGLLAWALERGIPNASRYVSLLALGIDAILVVQLWTKLNGMPALSPGAWLEEFRVPWIPRFGITLHLAVDGISLLLVTLTIFLGILSVGASWTRNQTAHRLLPFQSAVGSGRHSRRVLGARPVPVLLLLGNDADPDVSADHHLGSRKPHLRRHQVLSVHPGRRAADAALDRRPVLFFTARVTESTLSTT